MQSGRQAAKTIARRIGGTDDRRPFRYRDLGTMATISRFNALAHLGPVRLASFPAWVAWLTVHLTYLTGFRNRFAALAEWTTAFIGQDRRQRTITVQQVFARERALTAHSLVTATAMRAQDTDMTPRRRPTPILTSAKITCTSTFSYSLPG